MEYLAKLINKYQNNLEDLAIIASANVSQRVVDRTPVDESDLKNSWTPSINQPLAENIYVSEGDTKRHNIPKTLQSMKLGDKFYLCNGQPYANRIEYEGWSKYKAPLGMMHISLREWQSVVDSVIKKNK